LRIELNPTGLDGPAYVEFLNRCFPDEWDAGTYHWYLRRTFNGRAADLAVVLDGARIVAGLGLCPRQLVDAGGRVLDVCVLSAGATLPSERGRGHYARLLQYALELGRRHGCAALLGFTTRQNVSGAGLASLGALRIPAWYLLSKDSRPRSAVSRPVREIEPERIFAQTGRTGSACFAYAQPSDWNTQFIRRPRKVQGLHVAHDVQALVEPVGDTDRLQYLRCPRHKTIAAIAAISTASSARARRFFAYTADPLLAQSAGRLGLNLRPGLFHILPVDPARAPLAELARMQWQLHSGDRL
jgi:GNAT superfamily N-acetyltransferase